MRFSRKLTAGLLVLVGAGFATWSGLNMYTYAITCYEPCGGEGSTFCQNTANGGNPAWACHNFGTFFSGDFHCCDEGGNAGECACSDYAIPTPTPTPTPTPANGCNANCMGQPDGWCASGLTCYPCNTDTDCDLGIGVPIFRACRNASCEDDPACCPAPTPTPTPSPGLCGDFCGASAGGRTCYGTLSCSFLGGSEFRCRCNGCTGDTSCGCCDYVPPTPTPTPTPTPVPGCGGPCTLGQCPSGLSCGLMDDGSFKCINSLCRENLTTCICPSPTPTPGTITGGKCVLKNGKYQKENCSGKCPSIPTDETGVDCVACGDPEDDPGVCAVQPDGSGEIFDSCCPGSVAERSGDTCACQPTKDAVYRLFNLIGGIAIPITVILGIFLIVLKGYKIMTSQGDPTALQEGKEGLTSAIIGLIFVLMAVSILRVIIKALITGDADPLPI